MVFYLSKGVTQAFPLKITLEPRLYLLSKFMELLGGGRAIKSLLKGTTSELNQQPVSLVSLTPKLQSYSRVLKKAITVFLESLAKWNTSTVNWRVSGPGLGALNADEASESPSTRQL